MLRAVCPESRSWFSYSVETVTVGQTQGIFGDIWASTLDALGS